MRYPALPLINHPVGGTFTPVDRAWAALGQDLGAALRDLVGETSAALEEQDRHREIVARLGLAEGQRRLAADRDAVTLAVEAVALADAFIGRELRVAARLVLASAAWDLGELGKAAAALDEADELVNDDLERACAMLARARVLRYQSRHEEALQLAQGAFGHLEGSGEADALADAHREWSADLLMLGELEEARELAQAALTHHGETGDLYRSGQGLMLVGRSYGSSRSAKQLKTFRDAIDLASRIGSRSLEGAVHLHLAQLLQAGSTPDLPEWKAAYDHADRAAELAVDSLARAEVATTKAYLEIARFDPDGMAVALLDEAIATYRELGNLAGVATASKARARLLVQKSLEARGRARVERFAQALRAYSRAARLYRAVGMDQTARRLAAERLIATRAAAGGGADVKEARALLADSNPADLHDRTRSLLVLVDALLDEGPRRRDLRLVEGLLGEARSITEETSDRLLRAAVQFSSAEVDVARGNRLAAARNLRAGLRVLTDIDAALERGPARARFVDTVEPVTRRALRCAVAAQDGRSGIHLLEVRRSGRLAGIFRARGRVTIDDDIAGLLARIERRRRVEGGQLRGGAGVHPIEVEQAGEWLISTADLREHLALATSGAFAEVYDPEPIELDRLLADVPTHVDLLLVDQIDPSDPSEVVVAASHGPAGEIEITSCTLSDEALDLLSLLATDDPGRDRERAQVRPADLAALSCLLPPQLRARLLATENTDLLVIPSGSLWALPWAALPIGDHRLLVDAAATTVTPSLRVHALASRSEPAAPIREVLVWRGAVGVGGEELPELGVFARKGLAVSAPVEVSEFTSALRQGEEFGAVVMATHGDAEAGLAHGVQLRGERSLRAFDLLGAELPPFLFLGACHSAFSGGDFAMEPIGLPTVAMCAGASSVIAGCTRIPDSRPMSEMLAGIYGLVIDGTEPAHAVRQGVRRYARSTSLMDQPVVTWASITAIGTAPRASQPQPR